jgi:hypothetical protein
MRHPVYGFYKEAIKIAQQASDSTYSSGTTTLTDFIAAKNLTISAGATLRMPSNGNLSFVFADVLTINGTLQTDLNTTTGQYGGTSGAGAGNMFIFARQIVGTGTIEGSGGNAVASTSNPSSGNAVNGADGANGQYLSSTTATMQGRGGGYSSGGGSGGTKAITVSSSNLFYMFPHWLTQILDNYKIRAGSGGTGAANNSGGAYSAGAGGGASFIANGAPAATGGIGQTGTGGHGGGGGGLIYIASESAIPALTINAKGGNGSAGYSNGQSGGGGGGGLIAILAPATSATSTVTAGTGGTTSAENGIYVFLKNNLS